MYLEMLNTISNTNGYFICVFPKISTHVKRDYQCFVEKYLPSVFWEQLQ